MVLCIPTGYMGVDMGSTVVTDWANTWIRSFRHVNGNFCRTTRLLKCKDGFQFSIQAGPTLYSSPKEIADKYDEVEIGYPNMVEDMLLEWAENEDDPIDTVYGYVPVELVNKVIEKHGGICEKDFVMDKLKNDRSIR